jgi:two-component system sensor histidine kinase YesM
MRWFKKSLFAKLIVGMLIAAVIPFAVSNVISYKTTSDSMKHKVIELNQVVMENGMENVLRYLHDLNRISVSFYYREMLMNYLRLDQLQSHHILYIGQQIDLLYNQRPEFRGVTFSSENGKVFTRFAESVSWNITDSFETSTKHKNKRRYTVVQLGGERVFGIHKQLIDYPSSQSLGYLSIYVGLEGISSLIKYQPGPSQDQVFLFLHEDMDMLYASNDLESHQVLFTGKLSNFAGTKGAFSGELNGEKGIFIYVKRDFLGMPLAVFKFVSNQSINESANETLNRSLVIQSIAIGFVIVLASLLSYLMIAPIKRLLRTIARVETGNFEVKREVERQDELGILESRFHSMISNLDDLMNREYRHRLELSTAQLKMLQAQINPHFLYNALQSIGTLALRHGSEETSEKIAELGSILRYSMDIKTEVVTLQTELQHIEHYLSLQTNRFKNRLSYTISCSKEALKIHIPKMILQPLIENSIIHGLEKGKGNMTLHLSIEWNQKLRIRVIDSGKGISPETIERIRKEYVEAELHSGKDGGIGLINVLNRMRLYYGDGFSWDISSISYEMTMISLQVDGDWTEQGGTRR